MTRQQVIRLAVILGIIYFIWLVLQYHNPPTYCYLTGCHFTLVGWR